MSVKNNEKILDHLPHNGEVSQGIQYVEKIAGVTNFYEEEDSLYVLVPGQKKNSVIRRHPPEMCKTPVKPAVNGSI